jgi:hypothetical protein
MKCLCQMPPPPGRPSSDATSGGDPREPRRPAPGGKGTRLARRGRDRDNPGRRRTETCSHARPHHQAHRHSPRHARRPSCRRTTHSRLVTLPSAARRQEERLNELNCVMSGRLDRPYRCVTSMDIGVWEIHSMTAQAALKRALRDVVGPAARAAGFKGSGTTWRLQNSTGDWAIVNVQSSPWSTSETVRCVLNLAVAPAVWLHWMGEWLGSRSRSTSL